MPNLFDSVIKEPIARPTAPVKTESSDWLKPDSASPVENVLIKYINWQKNRNIKQELMEFTTKLTSDDFQAKTDLLMGFVGGVGKLKGSIFDYKISNSFKSLEEFKILFNKHMYHITDNKSAGKILKEGFSKPNINKWEQLITNKGTYVFAEHSAQGLGGMGTAIRYASSKGKTIFVLKKLPDSKLLIDETRLFGPNITIEANKAVVKKIFIDKSPILAKKLEIKLKNAGPNVKANEVVAKFIEDNNISWNIFKDKTFPAGRILDNIDKKNIVAAYKYNSSKDAWELMHPSYDKLKKNLNINNESIIASIKTNVDFDFRPGKIEESYKNLILKYTKNNKFDKKLIMKDMNNLIGDATRNYENKAPDELIHTIAMYNNMYFNGSNKISKNKAAVAISKAALKFKNMVKELE